MPRPAKEDLETEEDTGVNSDQAPESDQGTMV